MHKKHIESVQNLQTFSKGDSVLPPPQFPRWGEAPRATWTWDRCQLELEGDDILPDGKWHLQAMGEKNTSDFFLGIFCWGF